MSEFVGVVSFVKDAKTAKVKIERIVEHAVYKKRIKKYNYVACNTPSIEVSVGDLVGMVSCKPVSKTKAFEITRIVKKA